MSLRRSDSATKRVDKGSHFGRIGGQVIAQVARQFELYTLVAAAAVADVFRLNRRKDVVFSARLEACCAQFCRGQIPETDIETADVDAMGLVTIQSTVDSDHDIARFDELTALRFVKIV